MATLITFFSHTGNTKRIAEAIAEHTRADTEQIRETASRKGFFGYLSAGRDAWTKRPSEIQTLAKDPGSYDLVVVGTPVWAWSLTPPVRAFLETHGARLQRVAFFCTEGGSGAESVFKQMAELCGKQPIATLVLTEAEVRKGDFAAKVRAFTDTLGVAVPQA